MSVDRSRSFIFARDLLHSLSDGVNTLQFRSFVRWLTLLQIAHLHCISSRSSWYLKLHWRDFPRSFAFLLSPKAFLFYGRHREKCEWFHYNKMQSPRPTKCGKKKWLTDSSYHRTTTDQHLNPFVCWSRSYTQPAEAVSLCLLFCCYTLLLLLFYIYTIIFYDRRRWIDKISLTNRQIYTYNKSHQQQQIPATFFSCYVELGALNNSIL